MNSFLNMYIFEIEFRSYFSKRSTSKTSLGYEALLNEQIRFSAVIIGTG